MDKKVCTNICGVRAINVNLKGGNPINFNILVTCERPLGYDLLIGMKTIKEMGGGQITPSVEVESCHSESLLCVAITIDKPDFNAKFDQVAKV